MVNIILIVLKMEPQQCNILGYLSYYGPYLNSVIAFVHHHMNPQCCRYISENGKFARVESKCETTGDMAVFALTGKFDEFRLMQSKELSLDNVMNELYRWNLLDIHIPCKNEFGGHKVIVVRDNDIFYIIQSYLFEYNLKVHIANKTQVTAYINNYLSIFNTDQHTWSKSDIMLWKCVTNIILPEYNDTKPRINISWWYSYPHSFILNSRDCGRYLRKLFEEALIKLDMSEVEEIKDIFGNKTAEQITNDIQQLLDDLNSLSDFKLNIGQITNSGCLIDTEIPKINPPIGIKKSQNNCNSKITSIEVAKYLKNYEPIAYAKLYFSKEKEYWCYISEILTINNDMYRKRIPNLYIGLSHPNIEYIGDIKLGNFNAEQAKKLMAYMEIDDYTIPSEYDLMTMYYCYRNRLSCMELDSAYAKNKIIEYHEDMISSIDYEDMLVYLRTNAKIMGINVKGYPKYYKGNYDTGEIIDERIEQEVELLIILIGKRLEHLD
jgi:hypothetical protein